MSQKGLRFLTAPIQIERGDMVMKVVYSQDPDGNWLEFIEHISGPSPSAN